MNKFFPELNKKLGFGCMRLPMNENEVDNEQFKKMVDKFIADGFNYFDTAHVYINGKSESSIKECLTSRYERDKYILTDKLSNIFNSEEEIRPLIDLELDACGVSYFDFLLLHAQSRRNYEKYVACNAYKIAEELKKEGKIHHIGISFHDTAEYLEKILIEQPSIEVIQLQFNYADYNDLNIQSRLCYEVCCKYNKPVIVMEPVKGGSLVRLPYEANKILQSFNNGSNASYAVRFAASFDNIIMVLSGMSNLQQMEDNTSFMKKFIPLNEDEFKAIEKVSEIYHKQRIVPCTGCRYCVKGCPKQIPIPEAFSLLNALNENNDQTSYSKYKELVNNKGKASECLKCGKCENECPQHLHIRELLVNVSETFEE